MRFAKKSQQKAWRTRKRQKKIKNKKNTKAKKVRGGQMGQEDQGEPRRLAGSPFPKMKRPRII